MARATTKFASVGVNRTGTFPNPTVASVENSKVINRPPSDNVNLSPSVKVEPAGATSVICSAKRSFVSNDFVNVGEPNALELKN